MACREIRCKATCVPKCRWYESESETDGDSDIQSEQECESEVREVLHLDWSIKSGCRVNPLIGALSFIYVLQVIYISKLARSLTSLSNDSPFEKT